MIDYLNTKLGGEFASDPGLLPGILLLIYMVICGAYLTRLIFRTHYKEIFGPKEAFILITLLNGILVLVPTWLISIIMEIQFGLQSLDASAYHLIGMTLTTAVYRILLISLDKRKCQPKPSVDPADRRDFT